MRVISPPFGVAAASRASSRREAGHLRDPAAPVRIREQRSHTTSASTTSSARNSRTGHTGEEPSGDRRARVVRRALRDRRDAGNGTGALAREPLAGDVDVARKVVVFPASLAAPRRSPRAAPRHVAAERSAAASAGPSLALCSSPPRRRRAVAVPYRSGRRRSKAAPKPTTSTEPGPAAHWRSAAQPHRGRRVGMLGDGQDRRSALVASQRPPPARTGVKKRRVPAHPGFSPRLRNAARSTVGSSSVTGWSGRFDQPAPVDVVRQRLSRDSAAAAWAAGSGAPASIRSVDDDDHGARRVRGLRDGRRRGLERSQPHVPRLDLETLFASARPRQARADNVNCTRSTPGRTAVTTRGAGVRRTPPPPTPARPPRQATLLRYSDRHSELPPPHCRTGNPNTPSGTATPGVRGPQEPRAAGR